MSLHFAKTPFILTSLLFSKKTKVQASGLAPDLLTGLMPVTTEEEPEELEDDAPCRSALRIIDTLSASLPLAQVFPALSENLIINICLKQILVLVVEHFLLLVLLWKEFLNTCNRMLRLLCGPLLKRD